MRKFTLVGITAAMASLFAQTSTATSRTTASVDPEGLSSMPSSIRSFPAGYAHRSVLIGSSAGQRSLGGRSSSWHALAEQPSRSQV